MKTIQVNKIFSNYNIDQEKYENIIYIADKEIALYSKISKLYMGKDFLLKRALELIKTINTTENISRPNDSHTIAHRKNNFLESNIEKQLFINNFIFYDDEKFTHTLEMNNVTLENIEQLITSINNKKKEARITKNYELDIENICNLDNICAYYNFNNRELIINKIFELYYKQYELLTNTESKKR